MRRSLFEDVHEDFRSSFRTFLEREVLGEEGRYGEWERAEIVPREVYELAGQGGFLGMAVPEAYSGAGAKDFRFNMVIGEETQRAAVGSLGLGMSVHTDICVPYFLSYCTEPQRERWLDGIACGELIAAIAMTEPGIGSDLAAMSTSARREGDHYVVNGTKTFITNGINADLVITAVKTDPAQRHRGISLLVVERGMEGFERGRKLEKIGQHAQDTAELLVRRRARAAREPARRGGRGLPLSRLQPAAGAPVDRRRCDRRVRSSARLDARVCTRAHGLRPADRLLPGNALHARRAARRSRRSRACSSTSARRR